MPTAGAHATAAPAAGTVSCNGRGAFFARSTAAEKRRERPHDLLSAAIRARDGVIRIGHRAQLIEMGAAI